MADVDNIPQNAQAVFMPGPRGFITGTTKASVH